MRKTEHELKTHDIYWDAIASGEKTFEVRRNDRAFQTGDVLVLQRMIEGSSVFSSSWLPDDREPLRKRITYLLQGGQFGIEPGYCVLGLGEE